MFDLATALLAPVVVPMDINIDPNSDGLPGIAQLRTIVGAVRRSASSPPSSPSSSA